MRTALLLSLGIIFVICLPAMAQITISTNTFQPALGTVISSQQDASVDATFFNSLVSGTGGPMVWDFTGRTYGAEVLATVVSPASTPGIATFPTANLVIRTDLGADTVWSIHLSQPSLFWRIGMVTHSSIAGEIITPYQDTTPDYDFPITYGDQWTSFRHWTQIAGPDVYTDISDTIFHDVNAWGTVKYGSTEIPVLRIVETERYVYETYSGGILIGTFESNWTTVNFVTAGFTTPVSANRVVTSGTTTYSSYATGELLGTSTDVREEQTNSLPTSFGVEQNYPNPFNPRTEIRFSVPTRSDVRLTVYNLAGQEVRTLVDQQMGAGTYVADWDGKSSSGAEVASGVYLYRLQAGGFSQSRKMVLLK